MKNKEQRMKDDRKRYATMASRYNALMRFAAVQAVEFAVPSEIRDILQSTLNGRQQLEEARTKRRAMQDQQIAEAIPAHFANREYVEAENYNGTEGTYSDIDIQIFAMTLEKDRLARDQGPEITNLRNRIKDSYERK